MIARMENFAEDQEMIGRLANVTFSKIRSNVSSGGGTQNLAREYFSNISEDLKEKLYKIYQVDFELFNYNPDIFRCIEDDVQSKNIES